MRNTTRPAIRFRTCVLLIGLLVGLISGLLGVPPIQVRGQTPPAALELIVPVFGTISDTQAEARWTFRASQNQRFSARMQAISGNLIPYVELLDSRGTVLARSMASSAAIATIEDFEAPQAGVYTLRTAADRAGGANSRRRGDYSLTILPGFGYLLIDDPMTARSPFRQWEEPGALAKVNNGVLRLQLLGDRRAEFVTAEPLGALRDLYVQTDVQVERDNGYWETGLIVRGAEPPDGLSGYQFLVNSRGEWKFGFTRRAILTTLRDWQPIASGETGVVSTRFTLAVRAQGDSFTLYVNGAALSTVRDTTLREAGWVGLLAATGAPPQNFVSATFDNLRITLPVRPGPPIESAPATLRAWQGGRDAITAELAGQGVIPGIGKPGFVLTDAFVTNNAGGGIVFTPLSSAEQYADLIFAADLTWDAPSTDSACAFGFRAADADTFSFVWIDRRGGYGFREQRAADFQRLVYDVSPAIRAENGATNRLIVIAVGNTVTLYVNGTRVLSVDDVQQVRGSVYIAAYNYGQANTYCGFSTLWLRSLS